MGSGKTTIGREVAIHYKFPFFDCDAMIEKNEKMQINDIFKRQGECYFREKETELLSTLSLATSSIISTGGGSITNQQNQQLIQKLGQVIYLHCDFLTLMNRVANEKQNRPLLKNNTDEVIETLFKKRLLLYRRIASIEIDTTNLSINRVVTEVIEKVSV
tara:strand:- start:304 stop:783 length:480 start_codon:yes stop_codon:yes gene_type:complete